MSTKLPFNVYNSFIKRHTRDRSRQRQLDYLAPFRRPPHPPSSFKNSLQNVPSTPYQPYISTDGHSSYERLPAFPEGSSLQHVPSHQEGSDVMEAIPAIKDGHEKASGKRTRDMVIQGVVVPPRPVPPGDEECCMSGCVNCVYTAYSQELEEYMAAIDAAREALKAAHISQEDWPDEIENSGNVERVKGQEESGMDTGMSAFLALEKKLKTKHASENS
ncbi:uncharacterized protein L203_104537 [Cryptococcus depauperatus CBS 7841]|uniref:Oxidoreductase-like domain-containing protein n=1 Tax=Cryptococcus depauperatus CBS 7841 TaxID=1295531 RepID=A0AAJ8JVN4_9TREE